jgi:hypothetical protein
VGGDTVPGLRKTAVIYYRLTEMGALRAQSKWEGESFDFTEDVTLISYGGTTVENKLVNFAITQAMKENKNYKVDNQSMGGDTDPGARKIAVVRYYKGKQKSKVSAPEGGDLNWSHPTKW